MADHEVLVAGETLIDFIPDRPGPLTTVERFTKRAGGAPANVAVALSRLGEDPLFWTRIARDPFGAFLADTLEREGIPERFVERDGEAKTTLAFVTHDEEANRAFSFYREETADTRLSTGAVPNGALRDLSWVHVGGVTLTTEPAREATLDLARRAREAGCTVSFDPNVRPELWSGDLADLVGEMLALAHVVKASPEDLQGVGIEGDHEALAGTVCERGPHTALLTLGGEGALAVATDEAPWSGEAHHPGYAVEPVDTTGAGDAFLAGAIAALVGGEDLDEALAFANAVASTATTAEGAMTALPDREAVETLRTDDPIERDPGR
ncbi:carbohydrate kinase family protein [Natronorarus salvus]|uniref:carbohydrate kinase family protein n=1 Tax=Natronorarus salvus TaxID=3117733 RepID=UPI002F25F23E